VGTFIGVILAVVENAVDKQEVVAVFPLVGMFKSDGLLDRRVDREIFAVQVGQAVGLP